MHQHAHDHSYGNLKLAFWLNFGFTIVELFGAFITSSIAIASDALHDLGDSIALGLSVYLHKVSKREGNARFTYGYRRFSLLGAFINAIILLVGSGFVIYEAVGRLMNPEPVSSSGMFLFALLGVAVNGYAAYKVSSGKTLNERVISWHLLEDVLGWSAVLVASVFMMFFEVPELDALLAIGISAFILYNVWKNLKHTTLIFLQAVPHDIELDELEQVLVEMPEIRSVHHSHMWSLDGDYHLFSSHLVLDSDSWPQNLAAIKDRAKEKLLERGMKHVTLEFELKNEECKRDEHHV